MSEPAYLLGLYLHLARASQQRRRPHVRDRLLILAGAVASQMELYSVADYCRRTVLEHNPGHLIRRWPAFEAALQDDDFLHFLKHLLRRYPQERAERMLVNLGINMARERQTYYSDTEYAAALLGVSVETLEGGGDDQPVD